MFNNNYKFIDLFAGIGGFHIAMSNNGAECVFASEINKFARKTYIDNFYASSKKLFDGGFYNEDITKFPSSDIPDFDILCGGFPCQPFSQAGLKNGFNDDRGNLFFNISDIIQVKQPKAFFLENVRGLLTHDNGNTFKVIQETLTNKLGYSLYYKILNASDYGVPQSRQRIFLVGFKNDKLNSFLFPEPVPLKFNMSDVWGGECSREIGFTLRVGGRGSKITDRHNWDSYLVNGEVRTLGVKEAKLMQGFPDDFVFNCSLTQSMKQLGNSVAIPVVEAISRKIINYLDLLSEKK